MRERFPSAVRSNSENASVRCGAEAASACADARILDTAMVSIFAFLVADLVWAALIILARIGRAGAPKGMQPVL